MTSTTKQVTGASLAGAAIIGGVLLFQEPDAQRSESVADYSVPFELTVFTNDPVGYSPERGWCDRFVQVTWLTDTGEVISIHHRYYPRWAEVEVARRVGIRKWDIYVQSIPVGIPMGTFRLKRESVLP